MASSKKKYFFFDIDGTLTHPEIFGFVPPETLEIIQQLKEAGHFLSLATGRSYSMVEEFVEKTGISNVVCYGGNDVYVDGKCISHEPFDRQFAYDIIKECDEKNIPVGISYDHSFKFYTNSKELIETFKKYLDVIKFEYQENFDVENGPEITRIYAAISKEQQKSFQSLHGMVPQRHEDQPMVLIEPDDKSKGIKKMIELIGGEYEDVVVFGDGNNDIKMFQQTPFSIAMGNATEELKAVADFITKRSDEEGIRFAVEKFNWL